MHERLFLLPLLCQILLTLVIYVLLAIAKARASRRGEVDLARRALHPDAWPENVQQINNNLRNQFEAPLLFLVLGLMLWQLRMTGVAVQALMWLFVVTRVLHAYVHLGANHVPTRRRLFTAGVLTLLLMTVLVAWRVLFG